MITPSSPTFSMASPSSAPIDASREATVPTWAMLSRPLTGVALAFSASTTASAAAWMPRPSAAGLAPAATLRRPTRDHGLGQHGGGGGAVTGDVVGLGRDALGELGAEVLERVVQLDLTGDGDAVVGDRRATELLGEHDVPTARAEGHLDRVGELVRPRARAPDERPRRS